MTYSEELTKKVFDAVDADKNGDISLDEWLYAMVRFFWGKTKEGETLELLFGRIPMDRA